MKRKNKTKLLRIGETAKQTGISVSAIRYYDQIGLINSSYNGESNFRYFKEDDVKIILFIKKAQHLGFNLDEIKDLLKIWRKGKTVCPNIRALAKKKIKELNDKVFELKKLEHSLIDYINDSKDINCCPSEEKSVCKIVNKVSLKG